VYRDEWDYFNLATHLVIRRAYTLDGEHPTAYRPPGYPFLLAALMALGAGIPQLRTLNFLALGVCVWLLYSMLKRAYSPLAAVVGSLLVACYPILFYTAGTLYPQTFGSALFLGVLWCLTKESITAWEFLFSGVLLALLILTIPTFVLSVAVLLVWHCAFRRRGGVIGISLTLAVATLLVGAWTLRNHAVFHTFVFVSSNSGKNLLFGNSENTTPNAGVNVDISRYTAEANRRRLDEIERDEYYAAMAMQYIREHRWASFRLYWLKFLNYFNYRNELATHSEESALRDAVMLATYGPLLLLGITRLLMLRRWRPSPLEILFLLLYISSGLFSAVFFTRLRFRLPYDFLLIGIVAIFLDTAVRRRLSLPPPLPLPGHR
jgi:4-amino-4-deoxy-L-arabinose transferase-like glycosyltransferase